jgi:hypothetical protein
MHLQLLTIGKTVDRQFGARSGFFPNPRPIAAHFGPDWGLGFRNVKP